MKEVRKGLLAPEGVAKCAFVQVPREQRTGYHHRQTHQKSLQTKQTNIFFGIT